MADETTNATELPDANRKARRMSRLTCAQCEGMMLDAADGLLLPDEQTHFDLHLSDCTECARMLAEVKRGGAWMEMLKQAPPVPPEGLVDRILSKTSRNESSASAFMAQAAYAGSIFEQGSTNVLPFRAPAALRPRTRMGRVLHTVMQPRFAMTAAMAFFSLALTLNIAGVRFSDLRASDLKPSNLRRSLWTANSRVVQYYENLRVVYELESRVHEMQRESDSDGATQRGIVNAPKQEQEPAKRAPSGSPRSAAPRLHHERPELPSQSDRRPFRLIPVNDTSNFTAAVHSGSKGATA